MARVTLQECCDEARGLIGVHKYTEAIAICRHVLKRYPRHIRTYQILGEACLENRELTEAIDTFKRLLDNADPENFAAYAGLGVAYEEKGRFAEAIWYMERASELAPNNEETRSTLRRLYRQRDGVEPERIRHSKAALARLYTRGGQYRQAIEEFRRLLELEEHRDRMDLKVSLAEALWRDGRREQAAELAREVLQTAPDCLKLILILGKIALEKGRPEEGKAILDRARRLDPENRVAQVLFGETSPLPPAVVLIPGLELQAEAQVAPPATAEAVVEPVPAAVAEETAPSAAAEESAVEEVTPAVAELPVVPVGGEVALFAAPEALGEEAPTIALEPVVSPIEEQVAPVKKRRKRAAPGETEAPTPAPEVKDAEATVILSEPAAPSVAEAVTVTPPEVGAEEVPAAATEPAVPSVEQAVTVAAEVKAEEVPAAVTEPATPSVAEVVTVAAEVKAEEVLAAVTEPVVVTSLPAPALEPVEVKPVGMPAAVVQPVVAPIAEEAAPKKKRGKRAVPQETVLEAVPGVAAGPLSDIERYQLLLEQKPKDDELRLSLARAYRDGAQMKLAIGQYGMLVRAKHKLLPEVIADVEGIVASRPDNLEAHELLADLYGKNGQLQKALERYHWVLERLREGEKLGN